MSEKENITSSLKKYIETNDVENMKLLIFKNKINFNDKIKISNYYQEYPLLYITSIGCKSIEMIKLFVENKTDINIRRDDKYNSTTSLTDLIICNKNFSIFASYFIENNAILTKDDIEKIKKYSSENIINDLNLYLKLYDERQHKLLLNILSNDYYN